MKYEYYYKLTGILFNFFKNQLHLDTFGNIQLYITDMESWGQVRNRSIVIIDLNKILRYEPKDLIETQLVYILLHELFHIAQRIDDYKFSTNNTYFEAKEKEADCRALDCLLYYREYLESNFNLSFNDMLIRSIKNEISSYGVDKIKFEDYLTTEEYIGRLLYEITSESIVYDYIDEYRNITIDVRLNNLPYILHPIKIDGIFVCNIISILQSILLSYNYINSNNGKNISFDSDKDSVTIVIEYFSVNGLVAKEV